MMYPLVLGVPGAELLAWGASYLNHGKDNNSSKVARNATLVPAVFTVFGKTLNTVHPLVGRLRRLRGWFRPVKWGAIGLVLDNVVLRKLITARSEPDDASQCEKDEKKVSFWKRHGPQ
ncbi:unnamed protein product [Peronospora belbahrii]|uniref:Uncharacterized protein n=1 Tax=Peronospora belbahrii TaxID=622444 RepID=A0AAU9LBH6_9STRA|nr:unnamed protein product [Peronospora belbahrii]CAH0515874.1 unnamed protein product [Peronospora belbahrii]